MQDFEIRKTDTRGQALFAKRAFEKGAVVLHFQGVPVTRQEMLADPQLMARHERLLQIGPDSFLDLKDHSVFINHACLPNCMLRIAVGNCFLLAQQPIRAGEELTFDYSTSATDETNEWQMSCSCGVYGCRKVISGFGTLTDEQQSKLIERGVVARYLTGKQNT